MGQASSRIPRLLIADDHILVAEGLSRLLQPHFEILDCVTDGAALVEAAERLHPDVIVTDVAMPKLNGLDAIRTLRKRGNQVRVIVVTMHADPLLAAAAISAGASGYVLKHVASDELIVAIREVLAGRSYTSSLLTEPVSPVAQKSTPVEHAQPRLTARQQQVLQLIAEGHSTKQIAAQLNISRRTVEAHKYQLMETLDSHNVAELVHHAIRRGLISVPMTDV